MADLTGVNDTLPTRLGGVSLSSGLPDNYADVNANAQLLVFPANAGPVTPGTVAGNSGLIGGQYNTTLPTLTTGQQAAVQVDSSGRILVNVINSSFAVTQSTSPWVVSGTVAATQSGSWTVAATQSGTWTIGRTWTLASGTDSVSVVQSTSPWVTKDQSDGPVTPGTVASFSQLAGGQYNSTPPTLTTGQQAALQLDAAGRLLVDAAVTFPYDENWGTVGPTTLRTAAQIGNATGAADFAAGNSSAQTLRVVIASNQVAIPVTGTFWQTTQPVSGTIAVTQSTSPWVVSQSSTPWLTSDAADGPVTPGTVAGKSMLAGGQYNTTLPTLTTGQQAALQVDSSGRLIIAPTTQGPLTEDHNYGTVGANTLRTASQIGNAAGGADFAAGNSSAQTLRVVIATNQAVLTVQGDSASGAAKAGNPVQIGGVFNTTQPTVTTGETVEAQSTARGALIVSTGVDAFNIDNITGTVSLPTGAATSANQSTEITSLQLIDNIVGSGPGAGTAGTGSALAGGVYNTTLPTLTNGQQVGLQVDSTGRLIVVDTTDDIAPATINITARDTASTTTIVANGQNFITGTPTAGSTASFAFTSEDTVTMQVTGTWTGTLQIEISLDGGTTWSPRSVHQDGTAYIFNAFTENFTGEANVAGYTNLRIRATTAWTGTATVKVIESINPASVYIGSAITIADSTGDTISISANHDLGVADIIDTAGQYRAQSVTTTAAEALGAATILANRKSLTITPTNGTIYWGFSNAVTTTTGTPIFKNQSMSFAIGPNLHVWVIAGATTDCRMTEGS